MLKKNVGGIDRILRIVVGLALLVGFALSQNLILLIGIIPLATGLLGSCPLYSIFGFNTCPLKN